MLRQGRDVSSKFFARDIGRMPCGADDIYSAAVGVSVGVELRSFNSTFPWFVRSFVPKAIQTLRTYGLEK